MKHLKAYESIVLKVINVFGNWTIDKLRLKQEENEYIERCAYNFLEMKNFDMLYVDKIIYGENKIIIKFETKKERDSRYDVEKEEISEFLTYLNEPELFNNIKKYNI